METHRQTAEHATWEDLGQAGGLSWLQRALGISAQHVGPALVLRCRAVPSLLLNRVLGLDATADADLIDSVLARFRAQGLERFLLHVPADPACDSVRELLVARGLEPYPRRWVRFVRGSAPLELPASELAVTPLTDEHALEAARVLAPAFDLSPEAEPLLAAAVGLPGWHCYQVRIDGRMAGVGVLRVLGSEGHLAMAATAPEHRGRGVQRLLMTTRIQRAVELGCRTLVTETGEAVDGQPNSSFNNMLRCGFEPSGTLENWVPHGVTWLAPSASAP